jgi:hypothetical protein
VQRQSRVGIRQRDRQDEGVTQMVPAQELIHEIAARDLRLEAGIGPMRIDGQHLHQRLPEIHADVDEHPRLDEQPAQHADHELLVASGVAQPIGEVAAGSEALVAQDDATAEVIADSACMHEDRCQHRSPRSWALRIQCASLGTCREPDG